MDGCRVISDGMVSDLDGGVSVGDLCKMVGLNGLTFMSFFHVVADIVLRFLLDPCRQHSGLKQKNFTQIRTRIIKVSCDPLS